MKLHAVQPLRDVSLAIVGAEVEPWYDLKRQIPVPGPGRSLPCPDCRGRGGQHSDECSLDMSTDAMTSPSQQGPRSDCPRGVW